MSGNQITALGKYAIRGMLGKGAMGVVYDGWDPVIDRRVAIKTVRIPDAQDEEAAEGLARFKREAQAAGRLTHPNIVGVFDYGETEELAYIVMEFVEGRSLKDMVGGAERMTTATTIRLMEDILAGLTFSHDRGVVHRDIKPANIMITPDGRAKIADFGIARIEASSMTQAGTVLGTPAYMSPEQFMGQVVDRRTDIYSCGVLLYQLLTGDRPFDGSMTAIMHKVLTTVPPRPSEIVVTSPVSLDAVVAKAMARRPEDRFDTAAEFVQALHAPPEASVASDETIVAAPRLPPARPAVAAPPPEPPVAPVRRGSKLPLFVGGGVVLAAVAAAAAWFLQPVSRPAAPSSQQASIAPQSSPPSAPPRSVDPAPAPASSIPASRPPQPAPTPQGPPAVASAPSSFPVTPPSPPASVTPPPATPPSVAAQVNTPAPRPPTTTTASLPPPAATPAPVASQPPAASGAPAAPVAMASSQPAPAPAPVTVPPASSPPASSPFLATTTPTAPASPTPSPPAVQPATPAVPPPAAAPVRPAAAIEASLASSLAAVKCSLARAAVAADGTVAMSGVVGGGQPEDTLLRTAAEAQAASLTWQVQPFEGPYCAALDILRPVAEVVSRNRGAMELGQAGGPAPLVDNDVIALQVTMPGFAGFLHVAYLQHDATVSPQVPGPGYPSQTYAARAQIDLGKPRQDFEGWHVGPPFGTDMIVAVASTAPLFSRPLPDSQPLASYVASLQTAMDALRRRGGSVAAAAIVLDTRPGR